MPQKYNTDKLNLSGCLSGSFVIFSQSRFISCRTNLSGQIQFVRVFFLGKFSSSRLKDKHLGDLEHFKQKHLGDLEHFNKKHLGDLELICIFALKISKL